jgi:hypothetical protein
MYVILAQLQISLTTMGNRIVKDVPVPVPEPVKVPSGKSARVPKKPTPVTKKYKGVANESLFRNPECGSECDDEPKYAGDIRRHKLHTLIDILAESGYNFNIEIMDDCEFGRVFLYLPAKLSDIITMMHPVHHIATVIYFLNKGWDHKLE